MSLTSEKIQAQFANHLRHPDKNLAPEGIEDRRMQIYRDLVFKNIAGFITSGFPVLSKLYSEAGWQNMLRSFVDRHTSHSPYFLSLGGEFLSYLENEHESLPEDPPFLSELARYEWAELALFVSEDEIPDNRESSLGLLDQVPVLSSVAWPMMFSLSLIHI